MKQENKINIAELLKDCPKGMELDCTMFEGLEFDDIIDNKYLPIRCRVKNPDGGYNVYCFTKYGCWIDTTFTKCVIFPKGKTTWEGFQRPFEDGDIVAVTMIPKGIWIGIFKQYKETETETEFESYCCLNVVGEFRSTGFKNHSFIGLRLATKEEKQKLFDAIKDKGYKWNPKTKTLEKLVKPKFKVGNKIKYINGKNKDGVKKGIILSITNDTYDVAVTNDMGIFVPISEQDNWELVPNKFDINTLVPFESRVLVRGCDDYLWKPAIFGFYNKYIFYTLNGNTWTQCIPYEGNEHLLGTTNDCDEYYKNW